MNNNFYILEPEIGGDWGPKTIIENRVQIEAGTEFFPKITFLEYQFNVWLGDDILAGDACYIVSEHLAFDMVNSKASGISLENVEISADPQFFETLKTLFPSRTFPKFRRFIPLGSAQYNKNKKISRWSGHDANIGINVDYHPDDNSGAPALVSPYSLIVTESLWSVIKRHEISNCEVTEVYL